MYVQSRTISGWLVTAVLALFTYSGYFYFFQYIAPEKFPEAAVVSVQNGAALSEIADQLQKDNVIRSPFWFTNFIILLKQEKGVVGGSYYFEKPLSVHEVARRLSLGIFNIDQVKTTIPEGLNVPEVAEIIKKNYPQFNKDAFIELARHKEGYLFPDTYLFGSHIEPQEVLQLMTDTFNQKVKQKDIDEAITDFGKPLHDILTMASILEGEARQTRTRQIVAGILWNRIKNGMPLQVDATFKYINGKSTKDLTLADLKIDSPYNTYVRKGLPPTPVSNPGLDSIMAAVTPIMTDYVYFLTDDNGNMHYAKTLAEHEANKRRYLD